MNLISILITSKLPNQTTGEIHISHADSIYYDEKAKKAAIMTDVQ